MEENMLTTPKAILVAVVTDSYEVLSLNELNELTKTAGAEVASIVTQKRRAANPATYIGSGKIQEVLAEVHAFKANLVVFDTQLSPTQQKNLEGILEVSVIDRTGIILQIFADHAKSSEGKTQVEIAQLRYLLPRLKGKGTELSKLAGGIGTRGPGESKLETDRRHILSRITLLKRNLEEIEKNRLQLRRKREKNNVPIVAIAGYTNAGKSTLLNLLTNSDVLSEDKLFATLDSTTRRFKLPCGRDVLISDTVGFIRNLPHELIYAFKSTFEEIVTADVVLLTADVSSEDFDSQLQIAKDTLTEIGYDGAVIMVYNKVDCVKDDKLLFFPSSESVYISAKTGFGLDKLIQLIENNLNDLTSCRMIIPYAKISVYYNLKEQKKIVEEKFDGENVQLLCNLNERELATFSDFIK